MGDAFDQRAIEKGEAFAAYAAIAVGNADTFVSRAEKAENLRAAMASRATIEQAKGILMAQGGLSPDDAFALLVRATQRENRTLRDLAADVVARVQARPRADSSTTGPMPATDPVSPPE